MMSHRNQIKNRKNAKCNQMAGYISGNLLLIAMDNEEKTRPRIMISAQTSKNSSVYEGQFITDNGGNEIQLDNGPVSCKLK